MVQHDSFATQGDTDRMITIKINDITATFSGERWKCGDKVVQQMLNDSFDTDEIAVSDGYRISKYDTDVIGLDGVALDVVAHLRPEIIEYEADVIPEEEKEVVV